MFSAHFRVVVCPPSNDRVEFINEGLLWTAAMVLDDFFRFGQVLAEGFAARLDDGFKTK